MAAHDNWTSYDARKDVYAALEEICRWQTHPDKKIYVVADCAGSIALSTGLLDGTVPAAWLKGITASNVFFNPIFTKVNRLKASLPISLASVYNLAAGFWFSCTSSKDDAILQQLMNQVLRFYPVGGKEKLCNIVVCHRSELAFGRSVH